MALARLHIWNPGDLLKSADLNGEFNNILNNPTALISPLTGPVTINNASSVSGTTNPLLKLAWNAHSTLSLYPQTNANLSSSGADIFTFDGGAAGLQLHLAEISGGQRVFIWDNATPVPLTISTLIPPAFAVNGDITIGDIDVIGSNPMTLFRRVNTGLAASAVTQLFSAKNGASDTNGGAQAILAPSVASTENDGYAELIAYGQGTGSLSNNIVLTNRSAANTVTRRWVMDANGNLAPFAASVYSIGSLTAAVKGIGVGAGTGTAAGFVPSAINLDTAAGTGCPGNNAENDLKTYTLPANSFITAGDMLRVFMTFRCAANATTKRIRIYSGGTVIGDSTAIANNNQTFMVIVLILNTGGNTQFNFMYAMGNATNSIWSTALTGSANFLGTVWATNANQIVKATITLGAGAALNDVIQDAMIVEYLRKA